MFGKKKSPIDLEIVRVIGLMSKYEPNSLEYTAAAKNLELLYKGKSYDDGTRVDANTGLMVSAGLLQTAAILWVEKVQFGVITSKAIGFLIRLVR
jgi:hypothetical protein